MRSKRVYASRLQQCNNRLIICLLFNPSARIVAQDPFPDLIKDENENGEGNSWEPPVDLKRVHLEALVHAWSVGEEGSKASLKDETKVEDPVGHALSED